MTTLIGPDRKELEEASTVLRAGNIFADVSVPTARCVICRAPLRSKDNALRGTKSVIVGLYQVESIPRSIYICTPCAIAIGNVAAGIQAESQELGAGKEEI